MTPAEEAAEDLAGNPAAQDSGSGRVLAVLGAILVLLAAAQGLFRQHVRELDGRERLARTFLFEQLPLGLPVAQALDLGGGEHIVQLGDSTRIEEDAELRAELEKIRARERKQQASSGRGGGGSGGGRSRGGWGKKSFEPPDPVWKTLGPGSPGEPLEVTFVWYPEKRGEQALGRLFGTSAFGDIGRLGKSGGEVLIEGGSIPWQGYDVPFRRIRHFQRREGEPTFVDVVRANLTRGREPCVLFLRFEAGEAGSKDVLRRALSGLAPRES